MSGTQWQRGGLLGGSFLELAGSSIPIHTVCHEHLVWLVLTPRNGPFRSKHFSLSLWRLLESLAVGGVLLEPRRPLTHTWYFFIPWPACSCGWRPCEEMTGQCRCPPRTVRPQCEVCETHSFSFHPMAGCEGCNCSRRGTIEAAMPECDRDSGQCR